MARALKIILSVVVIAILIVALIAVYVLSNGLTTDVKTFFLVVDNKVIATDQGNLSIYDKCIYVRTVGDILLGKDQFTYKIIPNKSKSSFFFYVNGEKKFLTDVKDYAKYFDVEVSDGSIIVKRQSLLSVLSRLYVDSYIDLPDIERTESYFTLLISSSDGSKSIGIQFIHDVIVGLDQSNLEF